MENVTIAVIGLGYVGLPLAVEFGKHFKTIGFDIQQQRIQELKKGYDRTREVEAEAILESKNLLLTTHETDLKAANVFIITVPTPVNASKNPDLTPLRLASQTVGRVLKPQDIVVYESTVFPGCTEEECVPILENMSGLKFNEDFFAGYSPERVNPGDKNRTLTKIRKVVSGSDIPTTQTLERIYNTIIEAGTYTVSSIRVAEACKVIENAQRDLNIAFVNELALIFDRMGLDTVEVLEAAGTKWNFLPFRPGLVGGHCIGVDPYYLTYKAESLGYHPQVILAGRRINDNMGAFVAGKVVKMMINRNCNIKGARVLILGITFKENCPDIRNTKVVDVVRELQEFGTNISVYDPCADNAELEHEYGLSLVHQPEGKYDAVILAVSHEQFRHLDLSALVYDHSVVFDIKAFWTHTRVDARL
ncbi:MAG: nucleotide sugar dehydrogenase [Cytophagales bacterium]|nr:MAG: nucleotide sugar dehydrogenase [Cytophagales bacterium]TAF62142.1 MAG: nucleotide sugar dehydrogenase [Cytophagales bacterium]